MEIHTATAAADPHPLDPESLQQLAAHRDRACVTLIVPLDGTEPEKAHRTRLKNLIDEACDALEERVGADGAERLLRPVRSFDAEGHVERDAGAGLAIFADTARIRWCYLPWAVTAQAKVGERFCVKPLSPATAADLFFIVALSQDRARVFRADRAGVEQMELDDLPRHGVDDVPGADAETNRLQMHSGKQSKGPRGGMSEAIFHGHRDDTRGEDERVARLCRQTAEALRHALPERGAPIVVAAVERLAATFRHEATWMNIVAVIEGNPDDETAEQLHRRALVPFERHLDERMAARAEQLGDAIHRGRGSVDVASIVLAANDGRVDTLFVDRSSCRWGRLKLAEREVVVHDAPKPSDDDLVDRAISDTLARGGDVVPFVPDLIDADAMAALFRHS